MRYSAGLLERPPRTFPRGPRRGPVLRALALGSFLTVGLAASAGANFRSDVVACDRAGMRDVSACTRVISSGRVTQPGLLSKVYVKRGNALLRRADKRPQNGARLGRRAANDFDEAIRLDPRNHLAYFGRGLAYQYLLNDPQQAMNDYRRASRLAPWDSKAATQLRKLQASQGGATGGPRGGQTGGPRGGPRGGGGPGGGPGGGRGGPGGGFGPGGGGSGGGGSALRPTDVPDCERASARDVGACTRVINSGRITRQQKAIAYSNRGLANGKRGRGLRAIDDLSEAIRLSPRYHLAYYNRGRIYQYVLKRNRQAAADYRMAMSIAPWDGKAAAELRKLQGGSGFAPPGGSGGGNVDDDDEDE